MPLRARWYSGLCSLSIFSLVVSARLEAAVVYDQPPDSTGGSYQSSWWDPDGSDYDQYVWDKFKLTNSLAITEVRWRGGFDPAKSGSGGAVIEFAVAICGDVANGYQPAVVAPPLAEYRTAGNAGQTLAGTFGGVAMYDYAFTLPAPFLAATGSNYWLQIQAAQHGIPDWCVAAGTGGDGKYFRRTANVGDIFYQLVPGDAAFTLLASDAATVTISAIVAPVGAGTIVGAGAYPAGSPVMLTASPNAGYGFSNWTEKGTPVSTSATYSFIANADRTFVANFIPAWTILTRPSPGYAGSTSGSGTYNDGSSVTVVATPAVGFVFVNWTEFGTPLSASSNYTFAATANQMLTANFAPLPGTVVFDFDTGTPPLTPRGNTTPFSQTALGLTAQFSSPTPGAGGFSVQTDETLQYRMSQFYGNYLWPNSVFNPALDVQFSQPITNLAFTFATADFHQNETPTTLQLTAYTNSIALPAVGAATTHGAYLGDTMPMGTLSFGSVTPFDVVEIKIPPAPAAASDFLVDNIVVCLATTPQPQLAIRLSGTNMFIISWPASYSGYVLQVTAALNGSNWTSVSEPIIVTGSENQVTIVLVFAQCFYRLVHP